MNLEKIWLDYKNSLKAFLHSKVSNQDDVDDLLQDILIKTHKNLSKIRTEQSVKSWLFQVAQRTIIDFYRTREKSNQLDNQQLWYQEEDISAHTSLAHCIKPFIRALPDEMADLMQAIEIDGISQKQYAKDLGIPYSTLKSRVQKGKKSLRKLFDSCCQFQLDKKGHLVDFDKRTSNCNQC